MIECPNCEEKLVYHDYFGRRSYSEHYYIYPRSWIEKEGEIFRCENEECEMFQEYFYTDLEGNVYEGYPC